MASRLTDLQRRGQHARRRAGVGRGQVGQRDRRQRHQHQADAEPGEGEAGQEFGRRGRARAGRQQQARGRQEPGAHGQDVPAQERADPPGEQHRGEVAGAHAGEHDAREQRRQVAPVLQVEREHEEEGRGNPAKGDRGQRAHREGAVAEDGQPDERGAARGRTGALVRHERRDEHGRAGQRQPRPQRPALLPALHQRQDDGGQRGAHQRGAGQIRHRPLAPRLGHHAAHQQQGR